MAQKEKPLLRLLTRIVVNAHMLSLVLIFGAILGLLALPLLDRPISFDEKGLLAGAAHPTIGYTAAEALLPAASRISRSAGASGAFHKPGSAAALASELRRAGLAATQLTRPTVTAPGPSPGDAPAPCRCANVHTVVRAPRGDGLEALALVTPVAFAPQRSDAIAQRGGGCNQSAAGAELALTVGAMLVLHLARGPGNGAGDGAGPGGGRWLARDLIWVIPDLSCGPHQCLTAWVRQYHGEQSGAGTSGSLPLPARGRAEGLRAKAKVVEAQEEEEEQAGQQWRRGLEEQQEAESLRGRAAAVGAAAARSGGAGAATAAAAAEAAAASTGAAPALLRGGVIQQAVVLEAMAGASYDTPELLVIGHDGLLPKMDIYYLLRYLFNYPIAPTLWRDDEVAAAHGSVTSWLRRLLPEGVVADRAAQDYLHRLLTGLHFTGYQAVGRPSGAHAAFKDYMVDAATLRLVQRSPTRRSGSGPPPSASSLALPLASCLELVLRSLNNLVERVNRSSFLYVLTGLDRYVSVERYVGPAVALALVLQLQAAWSMMRCTQQLEVGPSGAAMAPRHTWSVAASRAAARTAVLAAAAGALRVLTCGLVPGAAIAWSPFHGDIAGWVRDQLSRQPLSSPAGFLLAAGLLLLVSAVASGVASAAGRLAAAAMEQVATCGVDRGSAQGTRLGAGKLDCGTEPMQAGAEPEGHGGQEQGEQAVAAQPQPPEVPAGPSAVWHAERVIVLTSTAAAKAALICLNWAAALVAGAYLAPLALVQGWAVARLQGGPAGGTASGGRVVGLAAWLAAAPLAVLWLATVGAAGVGGGERSTIASEVCQMSATNYWYAHVVVLAFWLFGLEPA